MKWLFIRVGWYYCKTNAGSHVRGNVPQNNSVRVYFKCVFQTREVAFFPGLKTSHVKTIYIERTLHIYTEKYFRKFKRDRWLFNPNLCGRGTIWYSQSECLFLLKFLFTNIVKQFVFIVQSSVFIHMFLNLGNTNAFICV